MKARDTTSHMHALRLAPAGKQAGLAATDLGSVRHEGSSTAIQDGTERRKIAEGAAQTGRAAIASTPAMDVSEADTPVPSKQSRNPHARTAVLLAALLLTVGAGIFIQPDARESGEKPASSETEADGGAKADAMPPAVEIADNVEQGVKGPEIAKDVALPATELLSPPADVPLEAAPDPQEPSLLNAHAFENTLGMKFVPVGQVHFSIWLTRVQDFEVFASEVNVTSNSWRVPGFRQQPDHPVVNVSWEDAVRFCEWLTAREHKLGNLPLSEIYRLPTDAEWSEAVGLSKEPGDSPAERDLAVLDMFPWGNQWPPPANAGNYTGEETGSEVAISGYDDGYAWTSPVGSFPPNQYGIYDMGGNVWQWCADLWKPGANSRVLRGASWYNSAVRYGLLSSCRLHASPERTSDCYGFRIVRAPLARHANTR